MPMVRPYQLHLLEQTDNFFNNCMQAYVFYVTDWGKDEEDESDKKIWEDNWDDDNVEDDFSVQLRYVLYIVCRYRQDIYIYIYIYIYNGTGLYPKCKSLGSKTIRPRRSCLLNFGLFICCLGLGFLVRDSLGDINLVMNSVLELGNKIQCRVASCLDVVLSNFHITSLVPSPLTLALCHGYFDHDITENILHRRSCF